MFSIKIHRMPKETILAVCDEEILGMKFSDGEKRIEVYGSFYGGRSIEEESLARYMEEATIVNLVGIRAVRKAIELDYVDEDRVLKIGETVHAQFAVLKK
ncbi:MAG: DUF424 family protein [Thermoplasmata archaeon]|nr:DUF424 family protein [Candidatus Sysuiplasma acidicola]MBX8646404.1 DUF424 family protein [Candidatus Sysuiplasma acidicola]